MDQSYGFYAFLITKPLMVTIGALILSSMTFWKFGSKCELVLKRLKSTFSTPSDPASSLEKTSPTQGWTGLAEAFTYVLYVMCCYLQVYMLPPATSGYLLLPPATSCYLLLPSATSCCLLLPPAPNYYLLLTPATSCYPPATSCYPRP